MEEEPITVDEEEYANNLQLALVEDATPVSHSNSSSSSITPNTVYKRRRPGPSKFKLPKGWSVKKILRKSGGLCDKYYRDPESGQQFRSLREVERYVLEGITPSPRIRKIKYIDDAKVENHTSEELTPIRTRGKRMLELEDNKDNQYQLAIVSTPSPSRSRSESFKLPDGWIVEEVPRRSGGSADKYYYEVGTGQKFRSLLAVERHVTQMEENLPLSVVLEEIKEKNLPLSKAFKLSRPTKSCGTYNSPKKDIESRKEEICLPSKVNWVIADSGDDEAWNAYVDETLVLDYVKQEWRNTFMIAVNNNKHSSPGSGFRFRLL